MARATLLVVDDESYIREFLAQVLSSNYQVILAKSGREALQLAVEKKPSLILLDVVMPGESGIATCRQLRCSPQTSQIPVIMLTAVNEHVERTAAFLAGADDYIVKPFIPVELQARIESKLRRTSEGSFGVPKDSEFANLRLNFEELNAEVNGTKVDLGPIEFKILNCLVKNQGKLVERQTLIDSVWGGDSTSDRALDPHINSLRKKLKQADGEVKTVYGRGYSFVARKAEA